MTAVLAGALFGLAVCLLFVIVRSLRWKREQAEKDFGRVIAGRYRTR